METSRVESGLTIDEEIHRFMAALGEHHSPRTVLVIVSGEDGINQKWSGGMVEAYGLAKRFCATVEHGWEQEDKEDAEE